MERMATASFRVIRVRRWSLAAGGIILVLGLLAWPFHRWVPVMAPSPGRQVPVGVTVMGRSLGGQTAAEAHRFLTDLRVQYGRPADPARQATLASGLDYVLPELNGYQLDVERTVQRALSAARGEAIAPVWIEVPAVVTAAQEYGHLPIYSAHPGKAAVTLIINVAWGEEHLPTILDTLKARNVRATFLITGKWAKNNPDRVRAIAAAGHEIGNHGYDDGKSPSDLARRGLIKDDIQQADTILREILGTQPRFYQPHKGEVNATIVKTARELGYTTVLWSLDTIDWRADATREVVRRRIVDKVKAGDLILMHPTPVIRQALPDILAGISAKGLQTMTLGEILTPQPVPPAPAGQ